MLLVGLFPSYVWRTLNNMTGACHFRTLKQVHSEGFKLWNCSLVSGTFVPCWNLKLVNLPVPLASTNWVINALRKTITNQGQPNISQKMTKNKMKPTNPNADTFVEEQRQYLFITCSSEPTCGTTWVDTLRRHSFKTLLLDTSSWTLLLDTLVRHSYLTLL